MIVLPKRRLLALAPLVLLAACGGGDGPPMSYQPVSYGYLTKLRLNVASVDIDDSLAPSIDPRDMSRFAPVSPTDALRQMAQDRLVANGSSGRAVFVIDNAAIFQNRNQLEGQMTVHLDVTTSDGTRSGYAEARVSRTRGYDRDGPNDTKAALNDLVTQMMTDMNVEFEYQVKRSLKAYLQTPTPPPPPAAPISSEALPPPAP